jgi:hypothetical protein
MPGKNRHRLSTLRYELLAIPSITEKKYLKIYYKNGCPDETTRLWIQKLWDSFLVLSQQALPNAQFGRIS